jgi:hypothetical protein
VVSTAVASRTVDELKGIDWKWQSMDGAMTKSPLGGKKQAKTRPTGANWG